MAAATVQVFPPNRADWDAKPSGEAISAAFPPLAVALNLEASAILQCQADQLGVLHGCDVIELRGPKGVGFEAASLSLAPMFRLRPDRTANGRGRSGVVRIPLAFRMPVLKGEFPAVDPAPASNLLPLAREEVGSSATGAQLDQTFAQFNRFLTQSVAPGVELAMQEEMMKDLRGAQAKVRVEFLEFQAHVVAANLTQRQIQAALDFNKTSAAQNIRKAGDAVHSPAEKAPSEKRLWLLIAAHHEFCGAHDCKGSPADGPLPSPAWIQQPTPAQMQAAWPKLAMLLIVSGYADLDCASTDFGVLVNCQVVHEKPAELGFGAAALAVAGAYRRQPGLRGERTSLRVEFPLPDVSILELPKVSRKEGVKITLAREVLLAEGRATTLARQAAQLTEAIDHVDLPGVSDTTRAQALAVVERCLHALIDETVGEEAERYSELLTETELKERLAYARSPEYAAIVAMDEKMASIYARLNGAIYARITKEAHSLYCAKHDCPQLPPYRGPRTATDPLPPPTP